MKQKLRLDPWIDGYLDYLRDVKKLKHASVKDFRSAFHRVCNFMEKHRPDLPVWKCSLQDLLAWLNHSRDEGYSEAGMAKELSHIRGLLEYSYRSGRCERNVLDGFTLNDRVGQKESRALTLEEAERLVKSCGRENAKARRRRLIVLLLYGCGLRNNELCQLDVGDVNVERQELFIERGKGDRQRLDEHFGNGPMRCPNCGSTKMLLIRIWSKTAGLVYDMVRDGSSGEQPTEVPQMASPVLVTVEQMAFAF